MSQRDPFDPRAVVPGVRVTAKMEAFYRALRRMNAAFNGPHDAGQVGRYAGYAHTMSRNGASPVQTLMALERCGLARRDRQGWRPVR